MQTVKLDLEGLDGNAFNLLGAFRAAAREQGWSAEQITAVFREASAGGYSHLLVTHAKFTESLAQCDD